MKEPTWIYWATFPIFVVLALIILPFAFAMAGIMWIWDRWGDAQHDGIRTRSM